MRDYDDNAVDTNTNNLNIKTAMFWVNFPSNVSPTDTIYVQMGISRDYEAANESGYQCQFQNSASVNIASFPSVAITSWSQSSSIQAITHRMQTSGSAFLTFCNDTKQQGYWTHNLITTANGASRMAAFNPQIFMLKG